MIDELKAAIADVQASGEKGDGLAPWSYPGGLAAAFLAKYGPALIAAVELADKCTEGLYWLSYDKDGVPRRCVELDAYDAAKKETNHEP